LVWCLSVVEEEGEALVAEAAVEAHLTASKKGNVARSMP
jgi:hypothetical protein